MVGLWLLWLQVSGPALECAVVRLPRVAPGRLQVCPCQYLQHIGKGNAAPPHPSMTTRCMDGALVEPDNACQDFSGPTLSPQQVQQWRQAGYALLNGVLPQALVALVQQQARSAFTKLAKCQEPGDGLGFPFLNTAKHGQLDAASQVPLHPRLLTAVSQLLGVPVEDILLGQAELWCKVGEAAGEGGWAPLQNQDQRMHMDYPNHYLTHPAPWSSPDAVTAILYLDDVDGACAACARVHVALLMPLFFTLNHALSPYTFHASTLPPRHRRRHWRRPAARRRRPPLRLPLHHDAGRGRHSVDKRPHTD